MNEPQHTVIHNHNMPSGDSCAFGGCFMFLSICVICYTLYSMAKFGYL